MEWRVVSQWLRPPIPASIRGMERTLISSRPAGHRQSIQASYSDSDFFSPSWAPARYTNPYSDPGFNTAPWKSTTINSSFADPDFFTSGWTAPTYIPKADATFLNPNWSVQTPVLFRYSGIDSSRINNYNLDPFASDAELRAQGWQISGGFMSWT